MEALIREWEQFEAGTSSSNLQKLPEMPRTFGDYLDFLLEYTYASVQDEAMQLVADIRDQILQHQVSGTRPSEDTTGTSNPAASTGSPSSVKN